VSSSACTKCQFDSEKEAINAKPKTLRRKCKNYIAYQCGVCKGKWHLMIKPKIKINNIGMRDL
jgi:hypothetical protein